MLVGRRSGAGFAPVAGRSGVGRTGALPALGFARATKKLTEQKDGKAGNSDQNVVGVPTHHTHYSEKTRKCLVQIS